MQRALIEAVLLGIVGGVVGVHVVLRRLAFMADALTHTVFPGMAVAFLLSGSLYVGALVTGVASAVLLTILTRNRRITSDAALADPADRVLLGRRDPGVAQPLVHRRPHRAAVRPGAGGRRRRDRGHRGHRRVRAGRALAAAQGAGAPLVRPRGRRRARLPDRHPRPGAQHPHHPGGGERGQGRRQRAGDRAADHAGGDGPAAGASPRRRDDGGGRGWSVPSAAGSDWSSATRPRCTTDGGSRRGRRSCWR